MLARLASFTNSEMAYREKQNDTAKRKGRVCGDPCVHEPERKDGAAQRPESDLCFGTLFGQFIVGHTRSLSQWL
jgi:hypothetical protein